MQRRIFYLQENVQTFILALTPHSPYRAQRLGLLFCRMRGLLPHMPLLSQHLQGAVPGVHPLLSHHHLSHCSMCSRAAGPQSTVNTGHEKKYTPAEKNRMEQLASFRKVCEECTNRRKLRSVLDSSSSGVNIFSLFVHFLSLSK